MLKEVHHETVKSSNNLAWLSRKPFEKKTLRSDKAVIDPFRRELGDRAIGQVTPDEILTFLNHLTDGNKPYTKRVRFAQLSFFFSFVRNNIDSESANPCDSAMIRKLYRQKVTSKWEIIEKGTIDEIIFRTTKNRNRLLLELMARGGMRVGEVLKLRLKDIQDQKWVLYDPKSGKEQEIVFIPQKVAERLRDYLNVSQLSKIKRHIGVIDGYRQLKDIQHLKISK